MHAVVFAAGHAYATTPAHTHTATPGLTHAAAPGPEHTTDPGLTRVAAPDLSYTGAPRHTRGAEAERTDDPRLTHFTRPGLTHFAIRGLTHTADTRHTLAPGIVGIGVPSIAAESMASSEHWSDRAQVLETHAEAGGDTGCADCGGGHHGLHGCVFVLVALALLLGLVVLAWVGVRRGAAGLWVRLERSGGARSPPWTVLSLPELSILRI
ncbi:hypothetical protein [Nocardia sp. N2S4-5]|uniref:hypothetical protein n=1 Tax=Nocardia sp. N2S4-5 TaxID=3351565 RepID=UPI0037D4FE6A